MHAGDGDAVFQAHQLGEHLGALDDGDLARSRLDDLGIALVDGGAGDDDAGADDVSRRVALEDGCAEAAEAIGGCAAAQVGAGDGVAEVEQNLGDSAHADAANSYEMNSLRLYEHGCRYASATLAAGLGKCGECAAGMAGWPRWYCGAQLSGASYVYKVRLRMSA